MRNWMPAASAIRPISPSSASTSRTRWPLPSPPIAGLQDIAPMVAKRWVTSAVRAPMRAATVAASQPAWPPPMTMTSNDSCRAIMADFYREPRKPGSENLPFAESFHVKQPGPGNKLRHEMNEELLLTYAKLPEDSLEDILDINPAK